MFLINSIWILLLIPYGTVILILVSYRNQSTGSDWIRTICFGPPDPSINKQKYEEKPWFLLFSDFLMICYLWRKIEEEKNFCLHLQAIRTGYGAGLIKLQIQGSGSIPKMSRIRNTAFIVSYFLEMLALVYCTGGAYDVGWNLLTPSTERGALVSGTRPSGNRFQRWSQSLSFPILQEQTTWNFFLNENSTFAYHAISCTGIRN